MSSLVTVPVSGKFASSLRAVELTPVVPILKEQEKASIVTTKNDTVIIFLQLTHGINILTTLVILLLIVDIGAASEHP